MKTIKMIKLASGPLGSFQPEREYSVTDEQAATWVEARVCVLVEPEVVEQPVVELDEVDADFTPSLEPEVIDKPVVNQSRRGKKFHPSKVGK